MPAPWTPRAAAGGGQPPALEDEVFPDFMFRSSRHVVVADAKYKLSAKNALSAQDGYQLFAYSHLATLNEQTSNMALILYPTRSGGRPRQFEFERLRERNYPLWLAHLPFPSRADIQSQGSWSAFIARLARAIGDFSTDWIPLQDEPMTPVV